MNQEEEKKNAKKGKKKGNPMELSDSFELNNIYESKTEIRSFSYEK